MTDKKPNPSENRRKRYFIDKRFQSKYIGVLLLFLILAAVAVAALIYFGTPRETALVSPDRDPFIDLMLTLVVVILIFTFAIIVFGIRFSHRIVGPIYAFNRHMALVKHGKYNHSLHLRNRDHFKNLGASFNSMLEILQNRENEDINRLSGMQEKIRGGESGDPDKLKSLLKEISEEIEGLRAKKRGYLE